MSGEPQTGWISSDVGQLFACWHPAAPGTPGRRAAVLLCDPFGSDRMNLHLTYRALATRLAAAGFDALRVDLPGTCDSSGHPRAPGAGQVEAWERGLQAAAGWLRATSGAPELCAFGALLGGTLALQLAARRTDVSGVCLWGALPTGRAFLREAAAFRALTKANKAGLRPTDFEEGDLEAQGFLITRATAEQLGALDPLRLEAPGLRHAALFRRNRGASLEPLLGALRRRGTTVHAQAEALVDIAHIQDTRAQPPGPLLDEVLAWFEATWPAGVTPARPRAAPLARRVTVTNRRGEPVEEEVVGFGHDGALVGVVTRPAPGPAAALARRRPAVVLVNGGSNHRVGINRNHVDWGRAWAARGLTVLRLDIRGLGDSPPDRPEELGVLYRDATRADVRAAFDLLAAREGATRFLVGGLCAGAYQAFHTALEDPRVRGLVMLNPLRFQRLDPGEPRRTTELDFRALSSYGKRALERATWERVAAGRVNVRGISASIATRLVARARARARGALARLRGERATPPATWLAGTLLALADRGCRLLLVFDARDEIVRVFDEHLAVDRPRLEATGQFQSVVLQETDHILSPLWSQEHVGQLLERALLAWAHDEAPPPPAPLPTPLAAGRSATAP